MLPFQKVLYLRREIFTVLTKENLKKILNLILKLLVTSLAIFIVLRKIDLTELWYHVRSIRLIYVSIALLVLALSKVLEAFRLNIFFRVKDVILSEKQNIKLYFLGMFYNLFLPGGIGGDGYKVYWLRKKQGAKLKSTIWASLLNRANGLFGLLILVAISTWFISFDYPFRNYTVLLIPFLYVIYYFGLRLFFRDYTPTLPKTTLLSIMIQFMQVVSAHFILVSLGLNAGYPDYWFLFLVSGILFAIPVTLGGFGSRELVFVFVAQYLTIDVNLSVALGLLTYVLRVILSFIGVYYLAFPKKLMD